MPISYIEIIKPVLVLEIDQTFSQGSLKNLMEMSKLTIEKLQAN